MAKAQLPQSLAQATLAKQAATMARATTGLGRLERRRQPVSFVAVAKAAHVSRSWLYHQPELRADIEQLRTGQPPPPSPPAQRATIESLQHQIQALRLETSRSVWKAKPSETNSRATSATTAKQHSEDNTCNDHTYLQ